MTTTRDRLAQVPISVDGKHIGLYALATAVAGKPQNEGNDLWKQATRRLKTRRLPGPPVTLRGNIPGSRQKTPLIPPEYAADAVRAVLLEPEIFFHDDGCKDALKALLAKSGLEDVSSVDRIAEEIEDSAAELVAQRAAMTLPGFEGHSQRREMRTWKDERGDVYGSVYDFLRWLGLDDECHSDWHHWLKADFEAGCNLADSQGCNLLEITLPGARNPTPFTNFAGFRTLITLSLRKSKIARGFADRALEVFGNVVVGDQRLHGEIDANAAAAPRQAREFVLGEAEAARQELALEQICERRMQLLADKLTARIDESLAAHAKTQEEAMARIHERLGEDRARVNLNVRAPKRALLRDPPIARDLSEQGRPLPLARYLDEREIENPALKDIRRSFAPTFGMLTQVLKKQKVRDQGGEQPLYTEQNHRPQLWYTENDREVLNMAFQMTEAHRDDLVSRLRSGPAAPAIQDRPRLGNIMDMLRGGA